MAAPRAYWTILIGESPTAFRAREVADLQPTLVQLQRTQPNAVLKWFEHGRLWASQTEAADAQRAGANASVESVARGLNAELAEHAEKPNDSATLRSVRSLRLIVR